jgi:biopolymer transport protein ExbD
MRFGRAASRTRELLVEITPMIDVVFLLIIFFMTTARFSQETKAELELPREQGEQQETAEEAGLVINIEASGTLIVNGTTITMPQLETVVGDEIARLQGRDPEQLKLMIRADRNGDTAQLNQVIERLRELGVGAARMATEVP